MTALAAADLARLERLLNGGHEIALAIGWSDDGNEELRIYDAETDDLLGKVEALAGYVGITFPNTNERSHA